MPRSLESFSICHCSLDLSFVKCETAFHCGKFFLGGGVLGLRGYCFMVLQFACFRFRCSVIGILLWLMVDGKTVYALLCPHVALEFEQLKTHCKWFANISHWQ
jgi:hypothetical protein